ncbi:hypothetical protein B9Z55_019838 [Caenorhabditis nigoni]|uniref:Uncharacterized protein n=1 Tax=Caenorhabditis nigoni TaxID=1611254 RepID=A0A2G5TK60_9PELO|nr:hypothetical protein B9Z55_019838 [Caenorhabditis nigoni]
MVDFKKKQTTRIVVRSSRKDVSSVPQRELKKRKSVHFEDEIYDGAVATSQFVTTTNREWTFVATSFDLPHENRVVKREAGDKELLVLCNYSEGSEDVPDFDDESDDHIPFNIFAEQGMRIAWQSGTNSSSVSTLRITSMLRLESRRQDISPFEESENIRRSSYSSLNDDMEKAFQGSLSCSNGKKHSRSRNPSTTEKNDDFESGDFWDIVEF